MYATYALVRGSSNKHLKTFCLSRKLSLPLSLLGRELVAVEAAFFCFTSIMYKFRVSSHDFNCKLNYLEIFFKASSISFSV